MTQSTAPWPTNQQSKPVEPPELDQYDDDSDIDNSDWIGSPVKHRLTFKTRDTSPNTNHREPK